MIKLLSGFKEVNRFPNNELWLSANNFPHTQKVSILFNYENDADIFELLLLCETLVNQGNTLSELHIPYVPYSRQDRRMTEDEPLSIKVFCNLINSLNFNKVLINDAHSAHSAVTTALLNNVYEYEQYNNVHLKTL